MSEKTSEKTNEKTNDEADARVRELASFRHKTIMRDEVVRALGPRADGVYADVTLGGGGHAEAILEAADGARLVGVDRDELAIAAASRRLSRFGDRLRVVHAPFGALEAFLPAAVADLTHSQDRKLDGVVADLGVSSPQLDDAARGMSLRREASSAPLDMRMDRSSGATARDLVAELSEQALADVLFSLGEERRSRRIAHSIKRAIERGEMQTTGDLRHAVYEAVGGEKQGGIDPATRTFQALRIAVNDELGELDRLLEALPGVLAEGGTAAVISFHSLEDGRVKRAFRMPGWTALTKGPVLASDEEIEGNPRARSAKLRAATRSSAAETRGVRSAQRYAERKARRFGGSSGGTGGDTGGEASG